ncbi:MAG: hypothetical protein HOO96_23220 [Polyangiaceae bacterium]|nr:hypothetical protein [Polyangiaceae bacterium]
MNTLSKLALIALLVPAAACASSAEPAPTVEAPAASTKDENLAICGAKTSASIALADGRRLTFCADDHGREIVAEDVPDGVAAARSRTAHAKDDCALDVFLAHTADAVPVPSALKASCELRRGHQVDVGARAVSATAVLVATPLGATTLDPNLERIHVFDEVASRFCNKTTGPAAFTLEICSDLCAGTTSGETCLQACTPRYWSSSLRQCPETNAVREDVVSCTGFTRVLVDVRDGSGDPWSNRVDTFVGPNHHANFDVFELGTFAQDSDIRVRGISDPGATHMHAFSCTDF